MRKFTGQEGPIFIGGLSHSGKTPLRLMLAAHPDLAMSRRTYMWDRFYDRYGDLNRPANFERCLEAMLGYKAIRALQADPERIRHQFWQGPPTYGRLFGLFHQQYATRLGKRRWGDQLGFVERYADRIFEAYPSARMIHMVRDPRDRMDVAMSLSRYRKGKVGWSTARWLHSARLTQRNLERYPGRYKVVRYETLVIRPEETVRAICEFIGEAFMPEMMYAGNTGTSGKETNVKRRGTCSGTSAQLREKETYRRMSKRDLAFTQAYTRHQLRGLDYPLEPTELTLPERLMFYFIDWPANRAGMAAWNTLNARTSPNLRQE